MKHSNVLHKNFQLFNFSSLLLVCCLLAGCRGAAERQLAAAAMEYNRTCPVRMSDLVRIDSLHYDRKGRDMVFCCTVLGLSHCVTSDDEAIRTVNDYCERESQAQLDKLRTDDNGRETLMLLKRAGASLSFAYSLHDGTSIARSTFAPSDM
jgi:hypothetical protein